MCRRELLLTQASPAEISNIFGFSSTVLPDRTGLYQTGAEEASSTGRMIGGTHAFIVPPAQTRRPKNLHEEGGVSEGGDSLARGDDLFDR